MDWKLKCLVQHVLAHAPYRAQAYRWLQRRVTRTYFDELPENVLSVYDYHVRNFLRLPSPTRSCAMEFGAGRNLVTSLLLSAAGAREIFAYDILRLATAEQINHVIRQLRVSGVPPPNQAWREVHDVDTDLKRYYRINYCAPGDARRTGLPAASVDFVCSTSTLEHIKREEIAAILTECRRIGSPDALLSFIVDYHDHYASADPRITRFNFYRYSDSSWAWFNPSSHYQNRLRHSDYEKLFRSHGLKALECRPIIPPDSMQELQHIPLSAAFKQYTHDDLMALNGFFLLSAAPTMRCEP